MKPGWILVQPSDPAYDAGHPVKYWSDAFGRSDLRAGEAGWYFNRGAKTGLTEEFFTIRAHDLR